MSLLFRRVLGGAVGICFLSSSLPARPTGRENPPGFWQRVGWRTPDGIHLAGLYHPAGRPGALTWILLHGLGSGKGEWDGFARRAAAACGDGFLIYDLRGHGESIDSEGVGKIDYRLWTQAGPDSPWGRMADDLESAVRMLRDRYRLPEERIAVGGASLGANVAMVYAGAHRAVPAVLLLSPGLVYAGVAVSQAYRAYGRRPLFMAASPDDGYAFESTRQLAIERGDAGLRLAQGNGSAHGVNMFQDPNFTQKLIDWITGVRKK